MSRNTKSLLGAVSVGAALLAALPVLARAEILAMLNYESKPEESLKAMRIPVSPQGRREGVAIIDVDPKSKNFGKIVTDLSIPPDVVAHHIFYNKDSSKAYITALGEGRAACDRHEAQALRDQDDRNTRV